MNQKVMLIGVAGGSASGKTTVARLITQGFDPADVALIEQDSYYHSLDHLPPVERAKTNFDHPLAMDFDLLRRQLSALLLRQTVEVPIYDHSTHTRTGATKIFGGQSVIVLDGIFALYDADIRSLMDLRIFVDVPHDLRLLRRIARDMSERGRTFDSVRAQYIETVRPMHFEFIEPARQYADILIPGGGENLAAVEVVRARVAKELAKGTLKTNTSR